MKHPLDEDWIRLLNDLAVMAGCDWYQDYEGSFVVYAKDKDAYENMIRYPTMTREQIQDIVMTTVKATINEYDKVKATKATIPHNDNDIATNDKPIDEHKFKDLLSSCDDDQKAIIQRFTRLMINSGIHGTLFGMTVIGAGHEGDHALVSLKVDLFNTSDQYVNFNQKQINLMKDYRLKMLKLEAPDSSPFFYITLLDNSDIVKAHGCDKAVVLQSMEEHDADKAKGIIR